MKSKLYLFTLLAISIAFMTSCGDDDGSVDPTDPNITSLLVVNEGNFGAGDGSISSFDIQSEVVTQNVYLAGGTLQSTAGNGSSFYSVVNNADKLDILDDDLTVTGTIADGLDNPISFAFVGNLGFVSCWGDISTAFGDDPDSYIAVIDLNTNTLIDSVMMSTRPQDLIAVGGNIYVANEGGEVVSVINPQNLQVSEIALGVSGASAFTIDAGGDIWALCTSGNLVEIDPISNTLTGSSIGELVVTGFDEKVAINNTGEIIYFLGGTNEDFTGATDVVAVDISSDTPVATSFISGGFALYAIGVNPTNGDVYVGDNNAFQSTGTGFRYSSDGTLISEFATGIGPNGFIFSIL